jgi:hypothetical protein
MKLYKNNLTLIIMLNYTNHTNYNENNNINYNYIYIFTSCMILVGCCIYIVKNYTYYKLFQINEQIIPINNEELVDAYAEIINPASVEINIIDL